MPLAGRRILLIGIGFYDYEAAIASEMRVLGGEVWIESQQPAPRRLWPGTGRTSQATALARHQAALLARAAALGPLDHVVVIKGDRLGTSFLAALRAAQPRAQFIAYHWDSMSRYPELIARQAAYDRVLTFDHVDAEANPGFLLRPLFHRPELTQVTPAAPEVDLCFIGWLHHDRLAQVESIERQARAYGLTSRIYLSTGLRTKLRLKLRGRDRHVHTVPIGFSEYVRATASARAIVDLPHPRQAGLTMRAIETIGVGRRLLTTARSVADYDIFSTGNVAMLDPVAQMIDADLVRASVAPVPTDIVERYSLSTWVTDVLGVTRPGPFRTLPTDKRGEA